MTIRLPRAVNLTTAAGIEVPRWLPPTATALAAIGLAASGYLSWEHYSAVSTLACPNEGGLDCEKVTSSAQSTLFGVPVALLGSAYFVGMLVLVIPPAWRLADQRFRRLCTLARLIGVGSGVVYVLYLVYAELFLIESICIWCTVVHVTAFALFVVVAFGTSLITSHRDDSAVHS